VPADVAILIVTYNSSEQIEACLRSVVEQRRQIVQQIIVVDNGSKDDTVDVIRREFPDVVVVTPGANLGFARGVNEAALHADADYLLLLNPDTVILDHAIDRVIEFARAHPEHGFYGGRTLKTDGRLEPSSCWGLPSLWSYACFAFGLSTLVRRNRLFDPESLGSWPRNTVCEVGVITGCFLLVSRAGWEELHGFDERYFMYGEDADLAARAWASGYRPVIVPDARLTHEVGMSSSTPIQKMRLLYRGKATYARTHWQGFSQTLALGLLGLGVFIRSFPALLIGKQDNRWRMLWNERATWLAGYEPVQAQAPRRTPEAQRSSRPPSA